jgi:Flp pilus assembly secretin CpaC
MRKRILALALFRWPRSPRQAARIRPRTKWDDSRVITVSTRGNAPVTQRITLALDKAAIVQLDTDARDVLVSNPGDRRRRGAHAAPHLPAGQKTGQTNAFFFDAAGHQILSIDIRVERDVTDFLHDPRRRARVRHRVAAMNDNIVLTGSVATPWARRAPRISPRASPATRPRSSTCSRSRPASRCC